MGGIKRIDIKNYLRKLKKVKTWQLILILIPLLFITATFMRFDHIKMTNLKAVVLEADEAEDDEAIAAALQNLKDFVFSHTIINIVEKNGEQVISFGTGPFYLEHQYNRKASAALAEAEANVATDENPNGNVFAAASAVCRPIALANGWSASDQRYIDCFMSEIAKYPTSDRIEDTYVASLPSTSLFRYDFASPIWTFTLSGIFILLCLALIVVIFTRGLIWCILRLALIFLKN